MKGNLFKKALIPIIILGGVLMFYSYDPAKVRIFPPCLLHHFTGLYCPGCGSSRALYQLLHGRLLAALDLNPLFIIALPVGGFFLVTRWRQSRRTVNGAPGKVIKAVWIWVIFGVIIVYGILRNIPVYPFTVLAP